LQILFFHPIEVVTRQTFFRFERACPCRRPTLPSLLYFLLLFCRPLGFRRAIAIHILSIIPHCFFCKKFVEKSYLAYTVAFVFGKKSNSAANSKIADWIFERSIACQMFFTYRFGGFF